MEGVVGIVRGDWSPGELFELLPVSYEGRGSKV